MGQAQVNPVRMEASGDVWHPAEISDRQLLELNDRLVMVRRLGGAFADLELSDRAKDRLVRLQSRAG